LIKKKRNKESNNKPNSQDVSSKPSIPTSIVSEKNEDISKKESFVPKNDDDVSDDQFFDDFFGEE